MHNFVFDVGDAGNKENIQRAKKKGKKEKSFIKLALTRLVER